MRVGRERRMDELKAVNFCFAQTEEERTIDRPTDRGRRRKGEDDERHSSPFVSFYSFHSQKDPLAIDSVRTNLQ